MASLIGHFEALHQRISFFLPLGFVVREEILTALHENWHYCVVRAQRTAWLAYGSCHEAISEADGHEKP